MYQSIFIYLLKSFEGKKLHKYTYIVDQLASSSKGHLYAKKVLDRISEFTREGAVYYGVQCRVDVTKEQ